MNILLLLGDGDPIVKDYELDEQGMIPNHIKRGVLSQDALYNFFDDIISQHPVLVLSYFEDVHQKLHFRHKKQVNRFDSAINGDHSQIMSRHSCYTMI